jgi:hypothetical protein
MGIFFKRKPLSRDRIGIRTATQQVRIQHYSPWRRRGIYSVGLISVLLVCWLSYWLGVSIGSLGSEQTGWELDVLRLKVTQLEDQKTQLLRRLALLQQTTSVEYEAYKEAKLNLTAMEARIMELNEELSFYKNIVSPSELKHGLHVQELRISEAKKDRGYLYRLVLTQVRGNGRIASGRVNITISGEQDGKPISYTLKDLSPNSIAYLSFSFKYFQRIEGSLAMPAGFAPSDLYIRINPKGTRLDPLQRSYSWKKVLAGGI